MKQFFAIIAVSVLLFFSCNGATKEKSNNNVPEFSVEEMVQNYEEHKNGITDILAYTANALDDYCGIQLVLDQKGVSQFYVYNFMWLGTDKPKQKDFDKLMPLVGLSQEELDTIVSKLRSINCLSVELMKSGSQFAKVLYWENEVCGYYYHLYYNALTDVEFAEMTKTMNYCLPYSNKMFLEYNPKNAKADATFPNGELYQQKLNLPRKE